jgi:hypothetical protein
MALADWAIRQSITIKELRLLFHIPNGGARPIKIVEGRRFSPEGQKLQRMGVKRGVHDYFLPVVREYMGRMRGGLWIEMKDKDGKLTPEQSWWDAEMQDQGYVTTTAYSWLGARDTILSYLGVLEQHPRPSKWPM